MEELYQNNDPFHPSGGAIGGTRQADPLSRICDPAQTTFAEALCLFRTLQRIDPRADLRLARVIMPETGSSTFEIVDRAVSLLVEVVDGPRLLPQLLQAFRVVDDRCRAKLTTVIGRYHRNPDWIDERMQDRCSRVRANMIEAFWGKSDVDAIGLFHRGLNDQAPRVVANAALGLYYAGRGDAVRILAMELGFNPSRPYRASGCWAMGKTGDTRFLKLLAEMVKDKDSRVRKNAFRAIGEIKRESERHKDREQCMLAFQKLHRNPNGMLHIQFSANQANGQSLQGLAPLDVQVLENHRPVWDYKVQERTSSSSEGVYDLHFQSHYGRGATAETGAAAAVAVDVPPMLQVEVRILNPRYYGAHDSFWFGE